uniref:ShKT domain-containing protein n=1 Tax=Rhabditophanes sp. KR3021 TaxID=114890 RepID=A0AC35TSV5_9BILA
MKFIITLSVVSLAVVAYTCVDIADDCNILAPLCNADPPVPYVQTHCQVTCGTCATTQSSCMDDIDNCGSLNICYLPAFSEFAWKHCKLTCNLCNSPNPSDITTPAPCFDTMPLEGCEDIFKYCSDPVYKPLMSEECPKTCGFCF